MEINQEFTPSIVFRLGPLQVTTTVVYTWIVMAVLLVAFYILGKRLRVWPTRFQNALEWFVESITGLIDSMIPGHGRQFLPIVGTLAIFIGALNLAGLVPGLRAPTSDLSTPLALALTVYFSVHYFGIRRNGLLGYLRHYIEPIFILAPIELASEVARTMSLTFRLFGNILGEEIIIAVLFLILPVLIPIPLMLFAIFTSIIQAYVFTLLSVVYISGAVEAHREPKGSASAPQEEAA